MQPFFPHLSSLSTTLPSGGGGISHNLACWLVVLITLAFKHVGGSMLDDIIRLHDSFFWCDLCSRYVMSLPHLLVFQWHHGTNLFELRTLSLRGNVRYSCSPVDGIMITNFIELSMSHMRRRGFVAPKIRYSSEKRPACWIHWKGNLRSEYIASVLAGPGVLSINNAIEM